MRRFTVVLTIAAAAVVLAACGSDSKTESTSATSAPAATSGGSNATTATTAAKSSGNASFADVCKGRAAAAAGAAASQAGQTFDYNTFATDLQFALDHAPSEIKADMTTLATPLVQYFKLIASANGNFAIVAQNPQFATLAQRLSAQDFKDAAQRVQAWFASHCS